MITFLIGLAVLLLGGIGYGALCQRVFRPDDRQTPAVRLEDGVDFIPMKSWKNSLIQLLNIAGTGPVLGPIQGILFGPIAFITIPIGCIIGGAFHDYMTGMISMREDGKQMPAMIRKYLGRNTYFVYNAFVCLLMLLVGAVFIYTPGDLFITQILKTDGSAANPIVWVVYGAIFAYYIAATLFPIDKIIGRIYPIFGAVLLLSAVGVFIGLLIKGYPLDELWQVGNIFDRHPDKKLNFMPVFFVTVACGIVSGFHSTQSTLVSRTVTKEKEGRMTFYNMMLLEGFIAMIWAVAAMGVINLGLASTSTSATSVVGIVSTDLLGKLGGIIAIVGVIVLPITSGDTALRGLRLMVADALHIEQSKKRNRLSISLVIFALVAAILIFAKLNANGFNVLWRYFAWANQTIAVFAFAMITVYMMKHRQPWPMAILPGMFYMFVISSFILNGEIGFRLNWTVSYIIAAVLTAAYAVVVYLAARNAAKRELL